MRLSLLHEGDEDLSPREAVLNLYDQGLTDLEIADQLQIPLEQVVEVVASVSRGYCRDACNGACKGACQRLGKQVMKLSQKGLKSHEIAARLQITPHKAAAYIRQNSYSPERKREISQKQWATRHQNIEFGEFSAADFERQMLATAQSFWNVVKFYAPKIRALQPTERETAINDIVRKVATGRNIPEVYHDILSSILVDKARAEHLL